MGVSYSTLGGWIAIFSLAGVVAWSRSARTSRDAVKAGAHRQKLEGGNAPNRKDPKEKAKRQRVEAFSKDVEEPIKAAAAQPKPRAPKAAPAPAPAADNSSDDGVDNREFARQLASLKQGTALNVTKKNEEKRQKSVKQSRARVIDEPVEPTKVSAPSSTAGADADDDESPIASPEVKASGDVSDMLEPKSAGPAVLRLTDTDKVKQKEKKAKPVEKVESKKQRQNRLKNEAAKIEREEAEKQRQVALEAQRRLARISEGRAAKDGSAFMAAQQPKQSVWTSNGADNSSASSNNGDFVPVQPLDTFDTSSHTDVSVTKAPTQATSQATAKPDKKPEGWISSLPSEEEQLEILRGQEESWSTVTTKKSAKGKKARSITDNASETEPTVTQPLQVVPVVSQPVVTKAQKTTVNGNGKPFSQQSAFAALSPSDEGEVEEEWDV